MAVSAPEGAETAIAKPNEGKGRLQLAGGRNLSEAPGGAHRGAMTPIVWSAALIAAP
jgi:hypothetical protein